jgi:mRNA-degrading endonuclease RelE of RelBE toxin-antitoxin system
VEFITGDLLSNPHRVGKQLVGPLEGTWSARRGSYRVLYEIDDSKKLVTVVDVDHRAHIYRSRRGGK